MIERGPRRRERPFLVAIGREVSLTFRRTLTFMALLAVAATSGCPDGGRVIVNGRPPPNFPPQVSQVEFPDQVMTAGQSLTVSGVESLFLDVDQPRRRCVGDAGRQPRSGLDSVFHRVAVFHRVNVATGRDARHYSLRWTDLGRLRSGGRSRERGAGCLYGRLLHADKEGSDRISPTGNQKAVLTVGHPDGSRVPSLGLACGKGLSGVRLLT